MCLVFGCCCARAEGSGWGLPGGGTTMVPEGVEDPNTEQPARATRPRRQAAVLTRPSLSVGGGRRRPAGYRRPPYHTVRASSPIGKRFRETFPFSLHVPGSSAVDYTVGRVEDAEPAG